MDNFTSVMGTARGGGNDLAKLILSYDENIHEEVVVEMLAAMNEKRFTAALLSLQAVFPYIEGHPHKSSLNTLVQYFTSKLASGDHLVSIGYVLKQQSNSTGFWCKEHMEEHLQDELLKKRSTKTINTEWIEQQWLQVIPPVLIPALEHEGTKALSLTSDESHQRKLREIDWAYVTSKMLAPGFSNDASVSSGKNMRRRALQAAQHSLMQPVEHSPTS